MQCQNIKQNIILSATVNSLLKFLYGFYGQCLVLFCKIKISDPIICDAGNEKEHLKVTLLRIESSLQGVLSCLPDFRPSSQSGMTGHPGYTSFLIAGSTGSSVGSSELREKAAEIIHEACK